METSCGTGINKDSDGTLVAAAKRGDTQAFEELVLRHRQRVLAVAQRITNNREDAEDVAQESFHKAFLHLDAFQEKSRFVDQSPNPEESCSQRERTQLLTEAINLLGPTIRTVILLRDVEERSIKETAQILGASITAVKARVFQGRRKLRRTLNPGFLGGLYTASQPDARRC